MELSFTNFVAASGATVTSSTEDATYVGNNLQTPERPFLPWRTTAVTAQNAVIDFGVGRVVRLLCLLNTNYQSATIEGNAADSWGAPAFSQAYTVGRNPWTGRYQTGVFLTAFAYRYLRLVIAAQGRTDGAAYFSTGGLWCGAIATLPRSYRWGERRSVVEPRLDVGPSSGAWRQRLSLGEPFLRLALDIQAPSYTEQPASGDELADWLALERQMRDADLWALHPEQSDAAQVGLWRRLNVAQWQEQQLGLSGTAWELEEPTGG